MKTRVTKLLCTTVAGLLLASPALARGQADEDVLIPSPRAPGAVPRTMVVSTSGPGSLGLGRLPPAAYGIPPHLVEKLGVPRELAQRIQDLTYESNEALIPLEADLKRAQLRLERQLQAASPDERAVLTQSEEVGRAETAVRRNRLTLMVQVKKLLGPDLWQKLEAELGSTRFQKHVEILRGPHGESAEPRPGMPLPRKP
jgi:hypothetical protein